MDDENFWNILGTTEKEIKEKLEERNKTEEKYTELLNKINFPDENYQAVIKKFIEVNEKAIGK